MLDLTQLKNSLEFIQSIVNNDLVPAFSDLSNTSGIFDNIIDTQNNLLIAVASLSALFQSLLQEEINIETSLYLPPADFSVLT